MLKMISAIVYWKEHLSPRGGRNVNHGPVLLFRKISGPHHQTSGSGGLVKSW